MTRARKVGKLFDLFLFCERCKCVMEEACVLFWFFFNMYFRVRKVDPLGHMPPSKCGLKMFGGEVIKLYVFSKANYWQVAGDTI